MRNSIVGLTPVATGRFWGDRNARLDEVDRFHTHRNGSDRSWLETFGYALVFLGSARVFCCQLRFSDYCGPSAEREGRGYRGCIWRRGEPDGIWSARRGDAIVAGDNLVRDHVHDLRIGAGTAHGQNIGTRRLLGSRESIEASANKGADAGSGGSSAAIEYCANNTDSSCDYAFGFTAGSGAAEETLNGWAQVFAELI